MDDLLDKECNKNICLLHIKHSISYASGHAFPILSTFVPFACTGFVSTLIWRIIASCFLVQADQSLIIHSLLSLLFSLPLSPPWQASGADGRRLLFLAAPRVVELELLQQHAELHSMLPASEPSSSQQSSRSLQNESSVPVA